MSFLKDLYSKIEIGYIQKAKIMEMKKKYMADQRKEIMKSKNFEKQCDDETTCSKK